MELEDFPATIDEHPEPKLLLVQVCAFLCPAAELLPHTRTIYVRKPLY